MTPADLQAQDSRAWMEKAAIDLRAARALLDAGIPGSALFHCQQAAEKIVTHPQGNSAGEWPGAVHGSSVLLPVSFAAVADSNDTDRVTVLLESDAPVSHPEPKLGRIDILKSLDVAGTGFSKPLDGALHAAGYGLVKRSHVIQ